VELLGHLDVHKHAERSSHHDCDRTQENLRLRLTASHIPHSQNPAGTIRKSPR